MGFENLYPMDSGRAILCLDNGYALLDAFAGDISHRIESKELILKQIEILNAGGDQEKLILDASPFTIPFRMNSLKMEFAFPLAGTEEVSFQNIVSGLDSDWSEAREKPEFTFDRLPAGSYQIQARATNKWNRSSQTVLVDVTVLKPWYLSQLSFIVYAVLILLTVFIIRYFILRRISNRERNINITKERELIRLRNEKLNAELSYRSEELANSTMAIIKKNEFLLKLKEIIKNQKEELGTRYPDKYFKEIVNRIDRNVSSMDDWKVFEFHFEKAHEKFLQKLMSKYPDLTHGDLRLCAYLRMNLSSKEIAPLLRISVRGVENHRYKLRKKLRLKPDENLTEFILSL
jgi:DNA-binding CsgD family transcriptional regulator